MDSEEYDEDEDEERRRKKRKKDSRYGGFIIDEAEVLTAFGYFSIFFLLMKAANNQALKTHLKLIKIISSKYYVLNST